MFTPERYEDTVDPKNPPNSVMRKPVRRAVVSWFLGSLVVFFILTGATLAYWLAVHPTPTADKNDRTEHVVGTSGYAVDGGHDPDPHPRNTKDELRFRGF